ncbi:hypothetical protein [Mycetocola zhujimingii]|uniref:Uncharacterized protein n=1 Tax=Mycetocola zhujimingii TaxID=2079792 RepID=A0A2U1TGX9_9MICO|nr:hypothetical protein [Mycetocola zhujimingii]PWC08100.1 hypothetical protein DF223_01725 [Mycetocola zhujimingii]
MTLYSDFGARKARQIIGDVLALFLIAVSVWLGTTVYAVIANLASFGEQMEDAGASFEEAMTEAGDTLGGVPLIGREIRVPFDGASGAGGALEAAGQGQQVAVGQLATGLGIGVAALPIIVIVVLWLIPRARFVWKARQARSVSTSGTGIDLLALRALATQDMSSLVKIHPDAMGAWRRGDEGVVRALAHLELKSSGVRLGR